jgi:hypothetical protein
LEHLKTHPIKREQSRHRADDVPTEEPTVASA